MHPLSPNPSPRTTHARPRGIKFPISANVSNKKLDLELDTSVGLAIVLAIELMPS